MSATRRLRASSYELLSSRLFRFDGWANSMRSKRQRSAGRSRPAGSRAFSLEPLEARQLLAADVMITEFMANNLSTLEDGDGISNDWIEIHNAGDEAIDLAGYRLTDDLDELSKWTFPSVDLEPGGYFVVFASGQDIANYVDGAGTLHTNFKLSAAGEFVGLVAPDGTVVSQYGSVTEDYPAQLGDVSYGIAQPVGGEPIQTGFMTVPTPGEPNVSADQVFEGFVGDVAISVDSGYYDEPFQVELTSDTPGATIYYTTDSSDPTENNGTIYTEPIQITDLTVLRAAAIRTNYIPGKIATNSYIYLDDVLSQNGDGLPTSWGVMGSGCNNSTPQAPARPNYDVDPQVVNDPRYRDTIRDDLMAIPVMSLVLDPEDLWSEETGIYSNTLKEGFAWERPVSVELIGTDGQTEFDIDAGVRIHGGWGRCPSQTNKHSLRLVFRNQYGAPKLDYPWFGEEATDSFDTVVLRANFNHSWATGGDTNATFINDQFAAETQLEMGYAASHSDWVHLYLNGLYWGLYNPMERPSAPFAADYFGGDKDEYDVLVVGTPTDGNLLAWNELTRAADRGDYDAVQEMLDIDAAIDYFIINQYGGNWDWPQNNWYASRRRVDGAKWYFHSWDAEGMFGRGLEENRVSATGGALGGLYGDLRQIEEFQVRYADRIQKHFFNGGLLTPEVNIERLNRLAAPIDRAVVGESARWGDGRFDQVNSVRTRDSHWLPRLEELRTDYFPNRADRVLEQWMNADLYPSIGAPALQINGENQYGGSIDSGDTLSMAVAATVTTDTTLVAIDSTTRVFVPIDDSLETGAGPRWYDVGFDAGDWITGPNGIGYGAAYDRLINTDIGAAWNANGSTSLYSRFEFDLDADFDAAAMERLELKMKFDDGYAVYLNGQLVHSTNAPSPAVWDSRATNKRLNLLNTLPNVVERTDLSQSLSLLQPGANVLAIHVLNHAADLGDILARPELILSDDVDVPLPVVYTLDGSDPRQTGGASVGVMYSNPIPLTETTEVNARAFSNGEWSALSKATFVVDPARPGDIVVSEINYHPAAPTVDELATIGTLEQDDFEFVEVFNRGDAVVDLSGAAFTEGVEFEFPAYGLPPGERAVVVHDMAAFELRYGTDIPVIGQFESGSLRDGGEEIAIADRDGDLLVELEYDDTGTWPQRADGVGGTLELIAPESTPGDELGKSSHWRGSTEFGGSPGREGTEPIGVVINEVLANTAPLAPRTDSVELHNPSGAAIDVSGWYLSDSQNDLLKYRIPDNTILESGAYLVFDESDFNPTPLNPEPTDFALSGAQGDDVWLVIPDEMGGVATFVDDVHFAATLTGESLGRVPNGSGRLAPQGRNTLGCGNSNARVGPLLISEFHYNPGEPSTAAMALDSNLVEDDLEFIEIHNPTNQDVMLTNWRLRGGVDFDFDDATVLAAAETLVVISFNPEAMANSDRLDAFRTHFGIDSDIRIVGGWGGQLSDSGEEVRLLRPDVSPAGNPDLIPRVSEDAVFYDDAAPWPMLADGGGSALARAIPTSFGGNVTNWTAAPPTPGRADISEAVAGDLTGDRRVTSADIDVLFDAVRRGSNVTFYDLDENSVLDERDVAHLVQTILATNFGDANLDGVVNAADLNEVGIHWQSENCKGWADGDFTGDGGVTAVDLNQVGINWRKSTPAAARVPRAPLPQQAIPVAIAEITSTAELADHHVKSAPSFAVIAQVESQDLPIRRYRIAQSRRASDMSLVPKQDDSLMFNLEDLDELFASARDVF